MRVSWQSEIDPFASAVLRKHWPGIPNLGNIRGIKNPEPVDVLCGGFPCQDISVAGKGAGIDGERSGLWREYARLIRELRPRWVVAENVPALRTRGYDRVADDLEAAGYTVQAFVVGADDIGAPHRRKRVWIVAYTNAPGRQQQRRGGLLDSERQTQRHDADGCDSARVAADAEGERHREGRALAQFDSERRRPCDASSAWRWSDAPQPTIRGVDDGIPVGLVRHRRPALAALGNSLIPQIAEAIGRAIMRIENPPP